MLFLKLCLALSLMQIALGINECCNGVNRIIQKKCIDGSNLTATLDCRDKYIISGLENAEFQINEDHDLVSDSLTSKSGRYCHTKLYESDETVYLLCFEDDHSFNIPTELSAGLSIVSIVFIVITICIYLIVPKLLDLQGKCIISSLIGLALAYLSLSINQLNSSVSHSTCLLLAYFTYYFFLYAYFWQNILSFHIWRTIINPPILKFKCNWYIAYVIYGIICPTGLLLLLIVANHSELAGFESIHPGLAMGSCWFQTARETLIYFYSPILVLVSLNIIFYVWTVISLWNSVLNADAKKKKVLKFRLFLCIKLFFIMGITWLFEVVSALYQNSPVLQYLFILTDCMNGLQGLLIFLILVVFRKRVIRGLANMAFFSARLPNRWKTMDDDESDQTDHDMNLTVVLS